MREGFQKERLDRSDISSRELGFWVLAISHFLRRNWIRLTKSWLRGLSLCSYSTTQAYSWYLDCLTFEDGANVLSWYVSNKPPTNASQHLRRAKTCTLNRSGARLLLLPDRKPFRAPFVSFYTLRLLCFLHFYLSWNKEGEKMREFKIY